MYFILQRKTAIIFIFLILTCASPVFTQQESRAYAEAGVWEIGISTSGSFRVDDKTNEFSGTLEQEKQLVLTGRIATFTKYFFMDSFHIGGILDFDAGLLYDSSGDFQTGSYLITLCANPGYTFPVTPLFQIDLTLKLGMAVSFRWFPSWNTFYMPATGCEIMCLFPVLENVVIGFGYNLIILFTPEQDIRIVDETLGTLTGAMSGIAYSHVLEFQVSFYF